LTSDARLEVLERRSGAHFWAKNAQNCHFCHFFTRDCTCVRNKRAAAAQMIMIVSHLENYDGFCGSLCAVFMIQYLHKLKAFLIWISEEGRNSDQIM
jgi:hypothetical protein